MCDGISVSRKSLQIRRWPKAAIQTRSPAICLCCTDSDYIAGEESYLATDKGAINWGHVLVLPVEHYRSGLACPPSTAAEMGRYLAALRLCYKAQVLV